MLNYLQASPEAKARLLMQKEKRKRDSASERGIETRAMLSHKNKSDERQVKVGSACTVGSVLVYTEQF